MEDGWPAPLVGDFLCAVTKGNGFAHYDKRTDVIFLLVNTNPRLYERTYKCATDGCQVKVKTDYEDKVTRVVSPKKKTRQDQPSDVHQHDNSAKLIKMLKIVHEELQYGLKAYMACGLRKVYTAIIYRCKGDKELLTLCPSAVELKSRWYRAYNKYFQVSFRRQGRTYF